MSTATEPIRTSERIMAEAFGQKHRGPILIDAKAGPTPEQVDAIIAEYESAARLKAEAVEAERQAKERIITLVRVWGVAAAGSEHSRIINGALNTAMVTEVTTTSLDEEKVREMYELLDEEAHKDIFPRIFGQRIKHELVSGAEDVLRTINVPKWLHTKIKAAFAACIKVTNSAPRVKVDLLTKEPKMRKPRAKKAVQG